MRHAGRPLASVSCLALLLAAIAAASCREDPASPPVSNEVDAQLMADIKAHEDQFFSAMARGDVDAMMEVYTDDVISLAPGAPMVRGKAALREFWNAYLHDATSHVEHETVQMERRGDLIYEVSTYRQEVRWKDGRVARDQGKWMTVKKLQPDGRWKTHVGAWASDLPPSPVPAPAPSPSPP